MPEIKDENTEKNDSVTEEKAAKSKKQTDGKAEKIAEPAVEKANITWDKYIFPKIHPDGWRFVAIAAAISLILFFICEELGFLGLLVTVFIFYFFRDPERHTPIDENLVIAPADGLVSAIGKYAPPSELGMGDEPVTRISIFLSLFNVHINRIPASGKIDKLVYVPGKFFNASLDKASTDNERQLVKMTTSYKDMPMAFSQIAGLVARRILCDLKEGEKVKSGEKFGLVRFGSRMDIYLPKGIEPLVVCGQEAVGGETVLADLSVKTARKGEVR